MAVRSTTVERILARIAGRAFGVVTRAELVEAGVTRSEIAHRIKAGALIREYPGVYRVGHRAPCIEARYIAAVKACGQGAVLSGLAAAFLWGLVKVSTPPEVTATRKRVVQGLKARRTRRLHPADVTTFRGIPITTVARTLVDIAAVLDVGDLARACHEAGVKHTTTPRQVEAVLARRANAPGAGKLRSIIRGDARVTLSRLESGFLAVLREAGLPLPETNRSVNGRRVDCRWPEHRLTVELDSYRYHSSRQAWERDRQREREARARGDEFRRFTHEDVFVDRRYMLAELGKLLPH